MKVFTTRLKEVDYVKVQKIAEEQNRSMNKQIETILQSFIRDYEKVNGKIEVSEDDFKPSK